MRTDELAERFGEAIRKDRSGDVPPVIGHRDEPVFVFEEETGPLTAQSDEGGEAVECAPQSPPAVRCLLFGHKNETEFSVGHLWMVCSRCDRGRLITPESGGFDE